VGSGVGVGGGVGVGTGVGVGVGVGVGDGVAVAAVGEAAVGMTRGVDVAELEQATTKRQMATDPAS